MLAIVTGGAGFIGGALAHRLVAEGHRVRVIDSLVNGHRDAVPESAEFVEGDIRDLGALMEVMTDAEVVFHQAAIRSVPRSVDDPIFTHDVNATGTLNVLMAASSQGVRRVVYASSSSVYGGRDEGAAREDMAPQPMSPYAVSKLTGEYYCRVWTILGRVSTVSLRYFNVFGPGQHRDSKYAAVFPSFVGALLEGRPPEVHWDGEQSRDFTFIDDVVAANLAAAGAGSDADGAVFNIGSDHPRTVNEALEAVSRAVGVWIDPTTSAKRAGDIRRSHADVSRARSMLGWQPRADWNDSVARTVKWFDPVTSPSTLA